MVNFNSNNTNVNNQSIGNDSTVVNGNNNNVYNTSVETVTPSEIYKVCQILDGDLTENDDLIIDKNPNWSCKMKFNQVQVYQETFQDYCIFYESVESIFQSSAINGKSLLRRINTIYRDELIDNNNLKSDEIIQQIIINLRGIVTKSYQATTLTQEHIEDVIISVVFFAFTRCKILKEPPKDFCK